MTFYIVLGIYAAILALIVYLTRRSFGLLGLGLIAGALMARLWAPDLTPLVAQAGIIIVQPPLLSIVAICLTLLPALLLIPRAPRAHGQIAMASNALLFAALAVVLTFDPFLAGVVADDSAKKLIDAIEQYQPTIVTAGVVLSLLDIWFARTSAPRKLDRKK